MSMLRRGLPILFLAVLVSGSSGLAQRHHFFGRFGPGGFGFGRHGFFPGVVHPGFGFRGAPFGRTFSAFGFGHHLFGDTFGFSRFGLGRTGLRFGSRHDSLFWPGYGLDPAWGLGVQESRVTFSGKSFVDRWKDQDPFQEAGIALSGQGSLRQGMDADAVVAILGTPLSRWTEDGREMWRYSAYLLIFEDGKLHRVR